MRLKRVFLTYALGFLIVMFSAFSNTLFAYEGDSEAEDEVVVSPSTEKKNQQIEDKKDEESKTIESSYPATALMIDKTKGGRKEYATARLTLDGKDINSDVPAILYKIGNETRTLVPIRVISEKLGGEVKWENDEQIVKIFYRGMIVQLKIDDAHALINGVSTPLPSAVPAKLMSYIDIQRTLVPVRFISEAFGAKVDWDNENRVVMITRNKKGELPELQPSQTLLSFEFNNSSKPKSLKINFSEELKQEVDDFYIPAEGSQERDRLVLDISDTKLELGGRAEYNHETEQYNISVNDDEVKSLRTSQYANEPYVTRVVLDIGVRQKYELTKEDKSLIVTLEEDPFSSIISRSDGPRTPKLTVREFMDYETIKPLEFSVLSFDPSIHKRFSLQNEGESFITLEFPKNAFVYEDYNASIDDEFIKTIVLSKLDDRVLMNIELQPGVSAYLNPNNQAGAWQELVFEREVKLLNPDGIIIGIDPGHGGPDPGAIGRMDGIATSEVDVLNNFIPMVKAKLEERGYNVRLARDEDIDMSLEARTKYAELINAKIFVSVHANASSSPQAHGIEVFANSSVPESERLASCILEEMIRLSGDKNRGVKDYNLHITRESLMPASLVELGFLTSPSDLKKLRDMGHLDTLAEGMTLGIERYINEE